MLTLTEKPFVTSRTGEVGSGQGTSDEALIGAIAAGNRRAMQALYARHNVRIYRFVLHLANDRSLAEDLVSEVFLDVWRAAEGFKAMSQLSTLHREVLDLVYYHEKSVDEVAEIVGAPVNTVKTRMFYARKRMQTLLEAAGLDAH